MNIGKPIRQDEYWPLANPVPVRKTEPSPLLPVKVPLKEPAKEPVKV